MSQAAAISFFCKHHHNSFFSHSEHHYNMMEKKIPSQKCNNQNTKNFQLVCENMLHMILQVRDDVI